MNGSEIARFKKLEDRYPPKVVFDLKEYRLSTVAILNFASCLITGRESLTGEIVGLRANHGRCRSK